MASRTDNTLIILGSGPGIARSVTTLFVQKRYNKIALIARRPESLEEEQNAVQDAAGVDVTVKAYATDISDIPSLRATLGKIEVDLGEPEVILFNAARVVQQVILEHSLEEMDLDWKITNSALYVTAQWAIPKLIKLAKTDDTSKPAILVTNSLLYKYPAADIFALSMTKAAQRILVQCLADTYSKDGVQIGVISVGGYVSPEAKHLNSTNIAKKTWDWFSKWKETQDFEVVITENGE